MPKIVHFEHAAAMFELKYHRPQNSQELETAFADAAAHAHHHGD
ncbi:hypothetical protein ACNKHT_14765 [Shigella flexneri]